MTKSFRINHHLNGNATVWPISAHLHSVKWDDWENSYDVFSTQVVENFAEGIWTKIEEDLPRTFKFYYSQDNGLIYTYTKYFGVRRAEITWVDPSDGSDQSADYAVEAVRKQITSGNWIVLPTKEPINKLEITINTKDILNSYLEQSSEFLSVVKEFTVDSGHCVFIDNGVYKLYRKGEDMPYVCKDEEELLAAMNALSVLDGLDNE